MAAFTLIEGLLVVALVALLLSLLLPGLGGARRTARATACCTQLRTIGLAVVLYTDTYRGAYPLSSHTAGSMVSDAAWLTSLEAFGAPRSVRLCPEDPFRAERPTSYATNDHFEPLTPGIDYSPVTGRTLPGGRTVALDKPWLIPRPASTIYAAEVAGEGVIDHLHSVGWTSAEQIAAAVAVTRHDGASNFLFADGHARAQAWTDLRAGWSPNRNPFNPASAP